MITAVEVVPGNTNEAVQTDAVLATETTTLPTGAVVMRAERVSDRFDYDGGTDQMGCPEGKRSIGKVRVDNGDLYYFSRSDCNGCPRKADCLTPGEREGTAEPRRRVYLSDVRKRKVLEGAAGRGGGGTSECGAGSSRSSMSR